MPETWATIPGFPGYEVSTLARVRSNRQSRGRDFRILAQEDLKNQPEYQRVTLLDVDGKPVRKRVHRLVAEAFVPKTDPSHNVVRHKVSPKDGGTHHPDNLLWGTHADNTQDSINRGEFFRGEQCHSAKLTEAEVLAVRADSAAGMSGPDIQFKYGISKGMCSKILRRRTWKHI